MRSKAGSSHMEAAFQITRAALLKAARVRKTVEGNAGSSEPFRPHKRREQVDDDGGGHCDRDISHPNGSLDVFAGEREHQAQGQADKPKREHCWQPNDQIHRSLLLCRF
jgi:hypothetical protein